MATATGVTGNAAEVSTQLRGILQSLLAPTASMKTLFGELGAESGKTLIEQQGLQGALEAVKSAVEASGEPFQKYIGSIEGQTLALTLTGEQAGTYSEKLAAMTKAAGAADTAFRQQSEGVNKAGFAWKQIKEQVEVAAQRIGDLLLPAVASVLPVITDFIDAGLDAVDFLADFAKANKDAVTPIEQAWDDIATKFTDTFRELSKATSEFLTSLKTAWDTDLNGIRTAAELIWTAVSTTVRLSSIRSLLLSTPRLES